MSRLALLLLILAAMYPMALMAQSTTQEGAKKKPVTENASDEIPKVTEEKSMSFWMEKKLEHSKSILESLTKADYHKLVQVANKMQLLGKLEGFVRRSSKEYKTQLHAFELANQELIRQANRENAEGATLAFNQLTTSCVACHKLIREGIE